MPTKSSLKQKLEQRVAELERRLAVVETKSASEPAWLKNAGWAADDPLYDEAMKLGAEWRAKENAKAARHARGR